MSKPDRIILQNEKLKWRRLMKMDNPVFKKRKHKYTTIMKIEG